MLAVAAAVVACAAYANLSFAVKDRDDYRFFPPFVRRVNQNGNRELGGENYHIARSIVAGTGFANPFRGRTGPTAWMPPVLPAILAGLLWATGGNRDAVMAVFIVLQVLVLIGTGFLVLALARRTTTRLGAWAAVAVFVLALLSHFRLAFQKTGDSWLVLLALDLLVAGLCWWRPLGTWKRAAGWGVFGGFCALSNPIAGFAWGMASTLAGLRRRAAAPLAVALLAAGVTVAPWFVRNWLVFGRVVLVKSNLFYELYQSQCLQPDGLLQHLIFTHHPSAGATREAQEYRALGEAAFLDRKREQFLRAVRSAPADFADRVALRFLGVTLWYVPFHRPGEARRPAMLWLRRVTHALPFLGLLALVLTGVHQCLHPAQWLVIGVYAFYLLPYAVVSYFLHYGFPLIGVKTLLVLWGIDRLPALWGRPSGPCEV
jgi:hypothetical protein